MKQKLEIEYDERRSLESTVDHLQSLVDGLRSGALTIARGDRRLLFLVKPDSPLEFTLHAERVGDRERLELALEWRRQHLVIGESLPRESLPRESLPRDIEREEVDEPEESEAREGSDESDDDDDFDDAAETVRQSNRLAQALQQHSPEPYHQRH